MPDSPALGKTIVDSGELGVNYWHSKRFRATFNYVVNHFGQGSDANATLKALTSSRNNWYCLEIFFFFLRRWRCSRRWPLFDSSVLLLSVVVRYIVLKDAEQHDVKLTPEHAVLPTTPPAQVPVQHFPASANPALGAPPMARAANVTVGPELNLGGGVALGTIMPTIPAEEPDPEPASTIQIVTKRDGSSVVVPPLGSKAPKRVFQAGQGVDATYISKYDAAPSDPTDPDSLGV